MSWRPCPKPRSSISSANASGHGKARSNAFGEYQLGRRAYNGGGGIARLVQAVIRCLNRWRQAKQRFNDDLSAVQARLDRLEALLVRIAEHLGVQA